MIRKISQKQASKINQYLKVRDKYLANNPNCEAKIIGCSYEANEVHHKKGRCGNDLIDDSYFLAVCRNCHNWIEGNVMEAKELGFSLNRLDK